MLQLAHGFADAGLRVELLLSCAAGPYLREVPDNVAVVNLKARSTVGSLPALVGYLRSDPPPFLLVTLARASIVALWARQLSHARTKVYVREANTISQLAPSTFKERFLPYAIRMTYPLADGIVAVSQGVAEDLHSFTGIERQRITTIYNPVVTDQLRVQSQLQPDHPWFTDDQPPIILGVGRLHPQKDFPTLFRAFAEVRQETRARLVILGDGAERERLSALAKELAFHDDLSMPGFVANPFAFMARASVFVLSSRYEGLPGALIQAMACGCPVVSTDCPSGPGEILQSGSIGSLVPVGDPHAMAKAIMSVLQHGADVEPLTKRAEEFTLKRSVDEYLSLLAPWSVAES